MPLVMYAFQPMQVLRSATVRIANSHYTAERTLSAHPDIGPIQVCHLALLDEERSLWEIPGTEAADSQLIAKSGRNAV